MASPISVFCLLFLVLVAISFEAARAELGSVGLGNTLSPNTPPTAWYSPSKRFAFGFFSEGKDTYRIGIYMVDGDRNLIVWTANPDKPPVSSNATIEFIDGKIVLKPEDRTIAPAGESARSASMLDNGNFVLYNQSDDIIWESFKYPSDSLLGGQILSTGKELVSSLSMMDHSLGRFRLKMQYDGNLVAYPMNTRDDFEGAYWVSDTAAFDRTTNNELLLSSNGTLFLVYNNSKSSILVPPYNSLPGNKNVLHRATLDYDGNFRLYFHMFDAEGKSEVFSRWEAIADLCDVKSFCGYNSYCTRNDSKPRCICIPGFDFIDPNNMFGGCERNFKDQRCINGKEDAGLHSMTAADLVWKDHPYFIAEVHEKEDCLMSCSEDCDCDAAIFFESSSCHKHKFPLKYLKDTNVSAGSNNSNAFLKLNDISTVAGDPGTYPEKTPWVTILILSLSFVTYSVIFLAIFSVFILKLRITKYREQLLNQTGKTSLASEFILRTCTYSDLKKATNGFKQELGKGSFGSVYKGTFDKGKSFVAVKKLEKVVEEGEREFRAEMRVIGRTRHKNLVRLIGYCIEGSRRLLVYEYMSNGSLADLLYRGRTRPIWQERVRLAQEVARGILYLHEECEAPIIHCDIKPQNILLDEFWTAKISDFGMAKLLMPDQTRTFTNARGTRGYMAPEWNKNSLISLKVDVYSFGIVLLEIICCRKNLEVNIVRPEETLLSFWAYECFAAGELDKLGGGEEADKKSFERMVQVALWCIQDDPTLRFPMRTVILMLEGIIEVPIPPRPTGNPDSRC